MGIEVAQVGVELLPLYAQVPIRFEVSEVLEVEAVNGGLGGLRLVLHPVDHPYVKDYDAQGGGQEGPVHWPERFDVRRWGFFLACGDALDCDPARAHIGGATVAVHSPDVHMLENRADLAVLWDIRVQPDARGQGIGSKLFAEAARWARAQGCRQLKVETQNVNVQACRFYAKQGCELGGIERYGYAGCAEVSHEVMLLWYLDL